jgi:hypothetical protein
MMLAMILLLLAGIGLALFGAVRLLAGEMASSSRTKVGCAPLICGILGIAAAVIGMAWS